jgi:hypothetical protein
MFEVFKLSLRRYIPLKAKEKALNLWNGISNSLQEGTFHKEP